ncbi:MAG: hypothetical protein WBA09_22245 [Candidatus Acidiferrum sp.]
MPAHDRMLTGQYHYLNLPSGHVLFVCEPRSYVGAEKHLQELGGFTFPEIEAHEQIPKEIAEHAAFKDAGLNANDTSYQALKKLAAKFGWPAIDPRR